MTGKSPVGSRHVTIQTGNNPSWYGEQHRISEELIDAVIGQYKMKPEYYENPIKGKFRSITVYLGDIDVWGICWKDGEYRLYMEYKGYDLYNCSSPFCLYKDLVGYVGDDIMGDSIEQVQARLDDAIRNFTGQILAMAKQREIDYIVDISVGAITQSTFKHSKQE